MKKFLKFIGIGIGLLLVAGLVIGIALNEPLPQGTAGPAADDLARKMLTALNHEAYQNTRYLEWTYQGGKNKYKWDKTMGRCTVKWDDYTVNLNLVKPEKSRVRKNGELLKDGNKNELIKKALAYFNNDSFWLVAPYKVFDEGTTRSLVDLKDGTQGLLVTYSSGGTTPGDSYLWQLNPDGFPNSFKMWVNIIPIGGLEASWDDWMVAASGAFLPKSHKLGLITLSMGTVKGYN